jgi:hypothetical protein
MSDLVTRASKYCQHRAQRSAGANIASIEARLQRYKPLDSVWRLAAYTLSRHVVALGDVKREFGAKLTYLVRELSSDVDALFLQRCTATLDWLSVASIPALQIRLCEVLDMVQQTTPCSPGNCLDRATARLMWAKQALLAGVERLTPSDPLAIDIHVCLGTVLSGVLTAEGAWQDGLFRYLLTC